MIWDLDAMREMVRRAPASSPKLRRARLNLFDLYRYCEEYDKIYQMIQDLKGEN